MCSRALLLWQNARPRNNGASRRAGMSGTGKCKLCQRERELRKSHVVPRFVRAKTRATSAVRSPRYYTGEGRKFGKLEQDLPKRSWLCHECEQRLSRSESVFAEAVYQRIWTGQTPSHNSQEEHIHRFLVSMAWRVWHWYDEHTTNSFGDISNLERLREAEEIWRMYLLGKRNDVGDFRLHMLVQPLVTAAPSESAVIANSYYWARGINLDLIGKGEPKEKVFMAYAKIPKVAILGMVEPETSGDWYRTLMEPGVGAAWSGKSQTIPSEILRYMCEQREKMLAVMKDTPQAIKGKTRQAMDALVESEREDYLKRDAVRSMVADDLMELPEYSIVSDAIGIAEKSTDPRGKELAELLGRLNDDELRTLHRETNRIGIRCKTLHTEDSFGFLASGKEETKEPGKAILVDVEVYRTRERALDKSRLPLILGLSSEDVVIAIGAEVVPLGRTKRREAPSPRAIAPTS